MNASQLINKTVKSNLSNWEELSPLKEQQLKSIVLLSQVNQFEIDETDFDAQHDQSSSQIYQNDISTTKNIVSKVTRFKFHFRNKN